MKKIKRIVLVICCISAMLISVDFFRFPECYISTWRKALLNDINAGNAEMIEYYQDTYIANGRILFE